MPVDSPAGFIADINATNPPGTDPTSEGDDTFRALKQNILNTIPNFDALITKTSDDINKTVQSNKDEAITGAAFRQWSFDEMVLNLLGTVAVDLPVGFRWQLEAKKRFELFMEAAADGNDLRLSLFDALEVLVNRPVTVDLVTGRLDFALTPTVAAAAMALLADVTDLRADIISGGHHSLGSNSQPSTRTFGVRYTSVVTDTIPAALGAVADSAANGLSYTAAAAHIATMTWGRVPNAFFAGISLNLITTSGLPTTDDAAVMAFAAEDTTAVASVFLQPGDVLRPHTVSGGGNVAPGFCHISATGLV